MASTNKTGKRKRNCIDTYNDINEGALVKNDEESSGVEVDQEDWVSKNVFLVQVLIEYITGSETLKHAIQSKLNQLWCLYL